MDELTTYNQERWNALVQAEIEFSRPYLDMTPEKAIEWLQQERVMHQNQTSINGKQVLCLASGGGQQSVALAMLGAEVTVFDFSPAQLQKDKVAAAHFGHTIRTVQGDMRDLSTFANDSFDIVWQPYSINFVPDYRPVFAEVARVLRVNGRYRLDFANAYLGGINEEDWNGVGYVLKRPYLDGQELQFDDPRWDVYAADGTLNRVVGPKEYQHTLKNIFNNLAGYGFLLLHYFEGPDNADVNAEPGSWDHFVATAPPWLGALTLYHPDIASPKDV